MSAPPKKSHKKRHVKHDADQKVSELSAVVKSEVGPSTGSQPDHIRDGENGYRVRLRILNPYLTCWLCKGYLIDAITVTDCLHTFCKSCFLIFFEEEKMCPKCKNPIQPSHQAISMTYDRTLQEIVYKLVPGLLEEERRRRNEFVVERQRLGLPIGSESSEEEEVMSKKQKKKKINGKTNGAENGRSNTASKENTPNGPCCSTENMATAHHRADEKDILEFITADSTPQISARFLQVSGFATVNTLKRFLSVSLHKDISRYNEYDLFCNDELMGRDFSVMFIRKSRWRDLPKSEPIKMIYRKHMDF